MVAGQDDSKGLFLHVENPWDVLMKFSSLRRKPGIFPFKDSGIFPSYLIRSQSISQGTSQTLI
jgi:hypothetical protein